jgi:hypothetical protein
VAPGPNWNDYLCYVGAVKGSPAALDADDAPNTTTPQVERVFFWKSSAAKLKSAVAGIVACGGTATATLWAYSLFTGRWYEVFSQAAAAADTAYYQTPGVVPENVPLFLQITSITDATFVGMLIN